MTEYVHLSGAEDVRRAGGMIQSAAEQFERNVAWLAEGLERDRTQRAEQADLEHARRVEALDRFEQLVTRLEKLSTDNADRKEAAIARLLARPSIA